jgi:hypothetical protein
MKPTITTILYISIILSSFAQSNRWSVTGIIQDEKGNGMPSATITLLHPVDSTLVTFGVTSSSGGFEIKNLRDEVLLLQVSFLGFETFHQNISRPNESNSFALGVVTLKEATADFDEITVEAVAPVTIKKDTIEFNADSFKTLPNANVEELLKRLPGVEVDSEGNIKAQGQTVRRIMVDGKEFFGNDPRLASKNLLAEAIDKVQVYDRRSDQSQFTGIDDGQREKTINLQLKESHKKGYFGNLIGGGGTENRYSLRGNVNKFSEKQQLSFLGMSNNTNEQGFLLMITLISTGEYRILCQEEGVKYVLPLVEQGIRAAFL